MNSSVQAIARYTLVEALRNRLAWLVVAFLATGIGLAELIGELAITETRQFQSAILGAWLRICAVLMVSLFVITSVVREFDDKGVELVLSLPMKRSHYLAGKLAGFSGVALITAALCSLFLLIYVPIDQVLYWGISLSCELLIVTTFSLLCLFTLSQVTLALSAVMAFYVLSRAISALQLMAADPYLRAPGIGDQVVHGLIDALAFILPELHRFTATEWLVYHTADWGTLLPVLGQSAVYLVLLVGASVFDLYRREL